MKRVLVGAGVILVACVPWLMASALVRSLLGGISPGATGASAPRGIPAGMLAAGFALAQVGTPYRWGAEQPGYGFDCSGLAQAAWRAADVRIPRVAQAQYDAGPAVGPGGALRPGDLVFFGSGPGSVTHVGIVVGNGTMVDAPHTGSAVRAEPFPESVGAHWGEDVYLGASRPGSS